MSFATFAVLLSAFSTSACNQNSKASSTPAPMSENKPVKVESPPSVEKDQYKAEIKATGTYTKGQESSFEVLLTTKSNYHINEEYPHTFKPTQAENITYANEKLNSRSDKDAFKLEDCASGKDKCTMRVTIRFTPQREGNLQIGGELKAGICNADRCLIEAIQLGSSIQVQPHKP